MDDTGASLQATMSAMGREAREGARALRLADAETRTKAIRGMAQAIRRVRDDEAYRAGLVVNACVQMEPIRWPLMATRFVEACGFGAGRMQAERPA